MVRRPGGDAMQPRPTGPRGRLPGPLRGGSPRGLASGPVEGRATPRRRRAPEESVAKRRRIEAPAALGRPAAEAIRSIDARGAAHRRGRGVPDLVAERLIPKGRARGPNASGTGGRSGDAGAACPAARGRPPSPAGSPRRDGRFEGSGSRPRDERFGGGVLRAPEGPAPSSRAGCGPAAPSGHARPCAGRLDRRAGATMRRRPDRSTRWRPASARSAGRRRTSSRRTRAGPACRRPCGDP